MLKNLIIVIDALGFDLLNKKNTPFLNEFGYKSKFKTILGYTSAILSSIYSGTYPEENDYWLNYYFDPENSPFKATHRYLKYIPPNLNNNRILRWIINQLIRFSRIPGVKKYHSANIPLQLLQYFDFQKEFFINPNVLGPKINTIFDILRKKNVNFSYLGWPFLKEQVIFQHLQKAIKQDFETLIIYLPKLDEILHKYPKNSFKTSKYLNFLDTSLKYHIKPLQESDINIIIHSDHGVGKIIKIHNLEKDIRKLDLKMGKDYIAFYDATIARFWCFNGNAIKKLNSSLSNLPFGKLLTKTDKINFKINFSHNKYGDLIFLLDEGTYIYPNYYSILFGIPVGAHGYNPNLESQNGIFLTNFKTHTNLITIKDSFQIFMTKLFN